MLYLKEQITLTKIQTKMSKNLFNYCLIMLAAVALTMTSCKKDDDDNTTGKSVSYDLMEKSNSDVSGKIEFIELTDGSIQAEISLSGTSNGETHPAHVHVNSAALGGDILISLNPVAGATGSSVTIFNQDDNGNTFTYSQIDNLDAYVNIHESSSQLNTILAQGDIGQNVLTGESISYDLEERAVNGISGEVTFSERKNGFALAVIDIDGTPAGGEHPAHIHMNSAAESGGILLSLTSVNGTTGISETEIRNADDGSRFDYNDVLTANAYVNVHLSPTDLATIVAQGDIGSNELTGETETFDLSEKDVGGISGDIEFAERKDGSVLATIVLNGTPPGGIHPAHIHDNDAATTGPIAFTFNPVDGNTGVSVTSIRVLDDGTPMNYQALDIFDGYVNVHLSANDLATIVAQGNIGIND